MACPTLGCRPWVVATSILQMRKQLTERMGLVHGCKPGIDSKPEAESLPFSMPPAPRTLTALLRCLLCHKACGPSPWQQEGLGNHTGVSGHSASHSEPHRWLCHSLGEDADRNSCYMKHWPNSHPPAIFQTVLLKLILLPPVALHFNP